jgi:hypothetical protein
MKAPPLAKNYKCLTPEERFRLIMAAAGRRDEAERDRLIRAGGRITLSMPDHAPFVDALNALAMHVFIDLLEEAARYHDAFDRLDSAEREDDDDDEVKPEGEPGSKADEDSEDDTDGDWDVWHRYFDLALASGYMLRAKAESWKLFCERLSVPPFLLWDKLPGFDRLQRALTLAEKAAFVPEGFLRWMNRLRPAGEPELTKVPLTADGLANATEETFQELVQHQTG